MADQMPPMFPIVTDDMADERVAAVYSDIRETRNTDFINNLWRVLANDPAALETTWDEIKRVMGPGELSPMIKDLIYIAVSATNNCTYCVRSHTASAKAKGATDEMLLELQAVTALANKTNRIAIGMQVPVDDAFI
jgi:AhpD family alkylhydroperoxidase